MSSFPKGRPTQIFFWMEDDLSGCSVVDSSEGMAMCRECGERREISYSLDVQSTSEIRFSTGVKG